MGHSPPRLLATKSPSPIVELRLQDAEGLPPGTLKKNYKSNCAGEPTPYSRNPTRPGHYKRQPSQQAPKCYAPPIRLGPLRMNPHH